MIKPFIQPLSGCQWKALYRLSLGICVYGLCWCFAGCTPMPEKDLQALEPVKTPALSQDEAKLPPPPPAPQSSPEIQPQEQECQKDEDCVLVSHHCCKCNSGGRKNAIHKKFHADLLKRREIGCAETACLTVINDEPVCRATRALCLNGKCAPQIPKVDAVPVEPIK